jgi:hypothetical protein
MKIVCLMKKSAAGIYMVNTIHKKHELSFVVFENEQLGKQKPGLLVRAIGVLKAPARLKKYIRKKILGTEKEQALKTFRINNALFGDQWKDVDPSIPFIEVASINSDPVYKKLKDIHPDLIIDKGTSIVKDHILDTADLALNAHSGLSPYYRGAYCTQWALTNWDPYNIGVTIHKLTKIIDGGDMLIQSRADITPADTVYSIDMQLAVLGTELFIDVIDNLKKNQPLSFHQQDFSQGYITNSRQWNQILEKNIHYMEDNGVISIMLEKPSRKQKLPIFEKLQTTCLDPADYEKNDCLNH